MVLCVDPIMIIRVNWWRIIRQFDGLQDPFLESDTDSPVELRKGMERDTLSKGFFKEKWIAVVYAGVILAIVYLLGLFTVERLYEMIFLRGFIPHTIILAFALGLGFLIYQHIQEGRSERNLAKLLAFVQNNREEIVSLAREHDERPREQNTLLNQLFKVVPEGRERELIVLLFRDWTESGEDFTLKRLEIYLDLEAQVSENFFRVPMMFGWMCPMLGFLGTVWGIAWSLGNFTGFMGDVDNVSRIKEGLGTITLGLGIAFDTTILGLVFAIMINGFATYQQRRESACLDTLERIALDVVKRLSLGAAKLEAGAKKREIGALDAAAITAWAEATRDLAKQVGNATRAPADPSAELMEAVTTLQHYVKYLALLAKQSDTMAAERQAVESAAEAIKSLKDFSEGLSNLNRASQDLLEAVKLLEKPREFRLVQQFSQKDRDADE
jgi:biopolymer transport protein ExbB/TolQ